MQSLIFLFTLSLAALAAGGPCNDFKCYRDLSSVDGTTQRRASNSSNNATTTITPIPSLTNGTSNSTGLSIFAPFLNITHATLPIKLFAISILPPFLNTTKTTSPIGLPTNTTLPLPPLQNATNATDTTLSFYPLPHTAVAPMPILTLSTVTVTLSTATSSVPTVSSSEQASSSAATSPTASPRKEKRFSS